MTEMMPPITRSLSLQLATYLVLGIGAVLLITSVVFFFYLGRFEIEKLNAKADATITFLSSAIEIPLWDFDDRSIKNLGRVISRDELVESIAIRDRRGNLIFSSGKRPTASLIHRTRDITSSGQRIGEVSISLTTRVIKENRNKLILLLSVGTLLVFAGLFVGTQFFIKRFFKLPLEELNQIAVSYAAGQYKIAEQSLPYVEFQPLAETLVKMGSTIQNQITTIQQADNLLRNLNEAVYRITIPEGRYEYFNPAAKNVFGYSSDDFLTRPLLIQEIIHPDFQGYFQQHWQDLLNNSFSPSYEYAVIAPDGNIRWIFQTNTAVYDTTGKIIALEGCCSNITARKISEEQNRKLEEQLIGIQRMEAIGTLAGGIAHDFNNILSAIIGHAEMALEESPAGSAVADDIEQILKAGNRAGALVNQILTFSRQSIIQFVPVQPHRIMKEVAGFIRPTFPTTIEIELHIPEQCRSILGDPIQLYQVVMNLCTNAFHAMEGKGGTLGLSLKEIELSANELIPYPQVQAGSFVELCVRDTGSGIPPEIRARMFEPFFTTKETGKGTGMGLSIVHGVVKRYGGFIVCHSTPGKGTAFNVYLPTIEKDIEAEFTEVERIPHGKEHILFVDDEEALVEMNTTLLKRLGYQVTAKTKSIEALQAFSNQPEKYAAVVTDLTMPGLTGIDLARRMLMVRPDLPIILCTGFSSQISETEARLVGIREFLMKPITRKDIAYKLRKVLDPLKVA